MFNQIYLFIEFCSNIDLIWKEGPVTEGIIERPFELNECPTKELNESTVGILKVRRTKLILETSFVRWPFGRHFILRISVVTCTP